MLFKSMGMPEQDVMLIAHSFVWRGSRRSCEVLFTNVRELPDESLRSGDDWRLIVDFPFDAEGHSPTEDLDRIVKFRAKNEPQRTLVWLPSFFSPRTQAELGKLVIIDRLLLGNALDQHGQHLSPQDRQTARLLLQNQQSALSQRLLQVVEAAFAIRSEPTSGTLDAAYDMSDSHFQSLDPSLVLQRPAKATLGEALTQLLDQALTHQFPKHPHFGQEIKSGKDLRQVLEVCQEAARSPAPRVYVEDKAVRQKLRNLCGPLELGQMDETHFVPSTFWKSHFNRLLAASGQPSPTARDLRRWMDEPEKRGLPREIQNLLVLVYADQTNRSFVRYGANHAPTLEDLPDELELQEQALPDLKDWETAVSRVADVLGHAVSKLLNAGNLAALASKVQETVKQYRPDCDRLPDRLRSVLANLGASEDEVSRADRTRTAKAVKAWLAACDGQEPTKLVAAIARAKLETNATTMGRSLKSAGDVLKSLRDTRWDLFTAVSHIQGDRAANAAQLVKDVVAWLKADEHALAGGLAAKLSQAEGRAIALLTPPKVIEPVPPATPVPTPGAKPWSTIDSGREERLSSAGWSTIVEDLGRRLNENDRRRLTIQWTLEEEEGPK
jgi:hypothetical protein